MIDVLLRAKKNIIFFRRFYYYYYFYYHQYRVVVHPSRKHSFVTFERIGMEVE